MEEKVLIQSVRIYPYLSHEDTKSVVDKLLRSDSNELLMVPDLEREHQYQCLLLEKYYTPALADSASIRNSQTDGIFRYMTISRHALRSYLQHLRKYMDPNPPAKKPSSHFESFDDPIEMMLEEADKMPPVSTVTNPYMHFLQTHTPATIQQKLDELVIGQPELTRAVADFLYYHALRQIHLDLPPRPLLIAGPSGSGKTEVWRAVNKLYGDTFSTNIIDGSNLSCDGWAGNYKISTFTTAKFADGGILVVDEFDKLARPKYTSGGENVALQMQSEFLKLFEGEHHITENKRPTNVTTKKMGFVLVGAFESLFDQKNAPKAKETAPIGFCAQRTATHACEASYQFSDEDFIAYGIMPEVIGRIASKCATRPLDEESYISIIRSPHSRVSMIEQVLKQYGIQICDIISQEELKALIAQSKENRTGVRWVSAQVENRLLEAIREQGLFPSRPKVAA